MSETLATSSKIWQKSELEEELPEYTTEVGICLTRKMFFIHSGRQDLTDLMPLSSPFFRTAFLIWFCEHAPAEYCLPQSSMPQFDYKLLNVPYKGELVACRGANLTNLDVMRSLAHSALRASLDLSKEDDCDFLSKFGAAIFTSQQHLTLSNEIQQAAAAVSSVSSPHLPIELNQLAYWIWQFRPDLQKAFTLKNLQSQAAYMLWLLSSGLMELNLRSYAVRHFNYEYLYASDPSYPEMSRIAHLYWQAKPEYATEKNDVAMRKTFSEWFENSCSPSFGLKNAGDGAAAATSSLIGDLSKIETVKRPDSVQSNGLNILGALSGDFGLGEHARTTAMAALETGIESSLISFVSTQNTQNYTDDTLLSTTTNIANYNTSVFIGAPYSFVHQLSRVWDALHKDNYRIYFGAWELETLPAIDKEQIEFFFDEAWAQSRFQYDCLARQLNMPVTYMPLAIRELPEINFKRFQYGLPERRFLFLYTFDGASGLPRKNPIATIKAFQTAFPLGTEPVGLVLKTKNLNSKDPSALHLRNIATTDSRIKLIDAHFSKQETYGLQLICDAYISLHRAEGFGMTIAEAMLLGKPTIATNYSGNTDFCLPETCCLVDFELVPIEPGEYRFSEGQKWAEADTECAAAHMRNLLSDSNMAARIGKAGREYVRANHSLSSVGARMKDRLVELWA